MKLLKKSKLLSALLVTALTLTACSSVNSSSNSNQTSSNLNKEEIVSKFYHTMKNQKSGDVKGTTTLDFSADDFKQKMSMEFESTTIAEPLAMHLKAKIDGNNLEIYLVDGVTYISNNGSTWLKTKDEKMLQSINQAPATANSDQYLDLFKSMSSHTDVEDLGHDYKISFKGTDDQLKSIMMPLFDQYSQDEQTKNMIKDNLTFEQAQIVYIVDKNTYLTKSSDIHIDMKINMNGKVAHMKNSSQFSLTNINQVKDIKLPEATKSALSLDNN